MDLAYLPRSTKGFKYLLCFIERVSSYMAAICLKNITAITVSEALKIFLSIIPAPARIESDFGAEFSRIFTLTCQKFNIEHSNQIPSRSQSQGNIEAGIRILKQGLSRLIASNPKGRNDWPSCIPKLIHTINSYFPYKSLLSCVQLFFNHWYSTNTSLQVLNPLKLSLLE